MMWYLDGDLEFRIPIKCIGSSEVSILHNLRARELEMFNSVKSFVTIDNLN